MKTMNHVIVESDPSDDEILDCNISDAALEAAAAAWPGNAKAFTVNLCTVMADCSS
jgi:hypothetical protein